MPTQQQLRTMLSITLLASTLFVITPGRLTAQQLPYKVVWYRPYHVSIINALADQRTPELQNLDNNFNYIRNVLGANTIVFRLGDEDDYWGQLGSGFSYDPQNPAHAKPQQSLAQESVLAIANKWGLKVIFAIGFSNWHKYISDQYGSTTNPPGAWSFIHALIDPTVYYGSLCTTNLAVVNLQNSCTRPYYSDSRIAGWLFDGEWVMYSPIDGQGPQQANTFLNRYWPFFYNLVHWQGSQTGFAGIYAFASPFHGVDAAVRNVKALKQMFTPAGSLHQPEYYGIEWYGKSCYNLTQVSADLTTELQAVSLADTADWPGDYTVAGNRIMMMEGATDRITSPGMAKYIADAMYTARYGGGVAGIFLWASDGFHDEYNGVAGYISHLMPDPGDAFIGTSSEQGQDTPAPAPSGWHWYRGGALTDPNNYQLITSVPAPAAYGTMSYTAITPAGQAVAEAFAIASNNEFYANPEPIVVTDGSGLGVTTLYWTTTAAHIQIRVGSPTGTLFAAGPSYGSAQTGKWVTNGMKFFLQDVTNGVPGTTIATATTYLIPNNGVIGADPNPIHTGSGVGATTLNVFVNPGIQTWEIHVGAPNGALFAQAGGVCDFQPGQATGNWVTNGMTFYLQDTTNGKPLTSANTLSTVTVGVGP